MTNKEPAKSGDEYDYLYWKNRLCLFSNHTGLGKKVKRRMNKRNRRRTKLELKGEQE